MALKSEPEAATPSDQRPDRLLPSWRWSIVLILLWLLPAFVFTGRSALAQPGGSLTGWGRDLLAGLWYWLYWAAACPWVYRIYVRWPLGRQGGLRGVAVHSMAGIAAAIGVALVAAVISIAILPRSQPAPEILARELVSRSATALHLLNFAKYWLVLGLMALIREVRLRRAAEQRTAAVALEASRLEGQLASATLQMLRVQLNPHFLFNALNSVSALVEKGDSDRAFRMIGVLGGLLRATLKPRDEHRIPLAEELDLVDRYLELERLRFEDRLRVRLDVPQACREILVPTLILQPAVENVVRHAVARRVTPVALDLQARLVDGRLVISIEDDGVGLPEGWTLEANSGVGLSTTAERLRLVYGDDHRLDVEPSPRGGVRCRIEVPGAVATIAEGADGS